MEIAELKGQDFGIEETKAQEIRNQFQPMLEKMAELEIEYNQIIKLPKNKDETAKKAGELRRKLVKVRTGTAEIHQKQKAFYLAGGRFVDAWKNAQLFASQGLEEKLLEIETYKQRMEAERVKKLQETRLQEITPYIEDVDQIAINFGAMQDDVWEAYFFKKKTDFEEMEAAKKKAEEDRILEQKKFEAEQKAKEERRQKHIKREFEVREYGRFFDWDSSHEETSDEDFQILIDKAEKSKSEYEAEQEKIRIENERLKKEAEEKEKARLKEEQKRKEAEKIEAEKRAKEEAKKQAEIKALRQKQAAIFLSKIEPYKKYLSKPLSGFDWEMMDEADFNKLLANAISTKEKEEAKQGDRERIKNWINGFQLPEIKTDGMTSSGIQSIEEIQEKFNSFKNWANGQTLKM